MTEQELSHWFFQKMNWHRSVQHLHQLPTVPEVAVEVDRHSRVGLSDGYDCAEISRHLEPAEGGRRGEGGG